ncbi:murein biosynthesis integral membrane protein MurJ [candidate division WWE3 bacterium CG09_land_8_20_14_0_10_47_33]|uniref:Probable lipid II flippase MurJ n=1 Tax=candidate division WWE3 bacterium CG_4_9_14_0_2_um_filter_48_10 TaxID=1975078 RepID=A0A2M8EK91_UNCKA|nr:MAG: murein biosynthesis integral membrane protein MurJ [candidate division WWE3 bacterium CG09_land_8_20_14_0_10_47_33]PIZ40917.1 MAG: murein biosynthesis integral membrane protein MurJ [candidate division WWE3 bacterium CG_4_10_14_0_2_um_filter_47_8]PJC23162.1 MAG: murein biosynthesis integral membrane protein MurJ [candidate division WWE3 bacterium CG_4_9_14_0_2_um_filter_48_10]PJE51637.1 MAG: murein biosynthesis integral membrane protein MurJ [candidate division WWE3 bacterium CG10_big_fi
MLRRALSSILQPFYRKQPDILSAAVLLSIFTLASRILGLVRDRALAQFFSESKIGLYFAAFRLPDTLFEILILGTLSAAFIPTFISYISKGKKKEAWEVTATVMNLTLIFFLALAAIIFFFAYPFSRLLAPGFSVEELGLMASMTRILLIAQGFFVLSLFLTGILKSFQRFLVPAIAPLFYNLGIIAGIFLLAGKLGIYAPVWGAVGGAFIYFAIHLPLAFHLGFRFTPSLNIFHPGVRKIINLAAPRTLEIGFWQILETSDLFFSSLISTASYGYFTFASHLATIPVSLFGTSLADAALPALSYQQKNLKQFRETFLTTFRQIIFLVAFFAVALIILRVPAVRLAFGTRRFTWESTVATGYALSAFAVGIVAQALTSLLVKSFYALSDTLTPVKVGVGTVLVNITLSACFILVLKTPVWGIAFAFALANILQMVVLACLLAAKAGIALWQMIYPLLKVGIASFFSGGTMYVLLKVLDRSAWDRRLSFLGYLTLPERFEKFVLDTRYTVNVIILTVVVAAVGIAVYLLAAKLLRIKELSLIHELSSRLPGLAKVTPPPQATGEESELA